MLRRAPLSSTLLGLLALLGGQAHAAVRLGDPLPPHPWQALSGDGRQLVVLYSHDCGDLGELWPTLLGLGLPIHAVNAEDVATPAPQGVPVWHGPEATRFARALKVSVYPTVLLVRGERVLNAWQGDLGGLAAK